jgi:hypothetical protein
VARGVRWSYHAVHIGEMGNSYKILVETADESRNNLGELGIN